MAKSFVHLPQEIIIDILIRLPAKSILCCCLVCKAWRTLTTDPDFLAAHGQRQPTDVILYKVLDATSSSSCTSNHASSVNIALDLLPISSNKADHQRLLRYPKQYPPNGSCLLLSSCNGVLLFKRNEGSYIICNPMTRQWADLPRLGDPKYSSPVYEYVFYFHQPSNKFKLLCHFCGDFTKNWYLLSTGASEPQHVANMLPEATKIDDLVLATPVDLHGRLHWLPRHHDFNGKQTTKIVVFDIVPETFHIISEPPEAKDLKLFCMDGLLAAVDFGMGRHINIWFLEDYIAGKWQCRHQVVMPIDPETNILLLPYEHAWLWRGAAVADNEGNILLGNTSRLAVYNVRTKTVREVDSVPKLIDKIFVSRHVFRENLVPHPHFHARSSSEVQVDYFWH